MGRSRFGGAVAPPKQNINPLLDQHIEIFLTAKANTKAYKTGYFYSTGLHGYRDFAPDIWPPTPESIEAYLYSVKKRGLKESSIRGYYKSLKIWLTWLVKRGKLASNPMAFVERPPAPKLLPRVPKEQDLRRLFDHLRASAHLGHWLDVRALALWSLAFDTGLRISELAALAVSDIPKDGSRIAFVRGGKTHADRMIVFSLATATALNRWLSIRATLPLPAGLDAVWVDHFHLSHWPSDKGEWRSFSTGGMRAELKALCIRAGCSHLVPHVLRHGYAVHALRNGANLSDIQRQLGHQNISTTSRYLMCDDAGRAARHDQHSPFAGLLGGDL